MAFLALIISDFDYGAGDNFLFQIFTVVTQWKVFVLKKSKFARVFQFTRE